MLFRSASMVRDSRLSSSRACLRTGARRLIGIRVWFRRLRTAVNQAEISIASTLKISCEIAADRLYGGPRGSREPSTVKDAQACRIQQNAPVTNFHQTPSAGKPSDCADFRSLLSIPNKRDLVKRAKCASRNLVSKIGRAHV